MDQAQLNWLTNFIRNIGDALSEDHNVFLAQEQETEGLLGEITKGVVA